eukprot:m.103897 g.103897  ORF g.103897 m.103897 type:complete len:352 (-) comp15605_c0_seq1:67-1122(-)
MAHHVKRLGQFFGRMQVRQAAREVFKAARQADKPSPDDPNRLRSRFERVTEKLTQAYREITGGSKVDALKVQVEAEHQNVAAATRACEGAELRVKDARAMLERKTEDVHKAIQEFKSTPDAMYAFYNQKNMELLSCSEQQAVVDRQAERQVCVEALEKATRQYATALATKHSAEVEVSEARSVLVFFGTVIGLCGGVVTMLFSARRIKKAVHDSIAQSQETMQAGVEKALVEANERQSEATKKLLESLDEKTAILEHTAAATQLTNRLASDTVRADLAPELRRLENAAITLQQISTGAAGETHGGRKRHGVTTADGTFTGPAAAAPALTAVEAGVLTFVALCFLSNASVGL